MKSNCVGLKIGAGGRNPFDLIRTGSTARSLSPAGFRVNTRPSGDFPSFSKTYKSITYKNQLGKPCADLGYFRFPRLHFGYTFPMMIQSVMSLISCRKLLLPLIQGRRVAALIFLQAIQQCLHVLPVARWAPRLSLSS